MKQGTRIGASASPGAEDGAGSRGTRVPGAELAGAAMTAVRRAATMPAEAAPTRPVGPQNRAVPEVWVETFMVVPLRFRGRAPRDAPVVLPIGIASVCDR